MFEKTITLTSLVTLALALTACGGGGGGGGTGAGAVAGGSTVIAGTASKGPLNRGTVEVRAVNGDGTVGPVLKSGSTDENGRYSIDIGTYTGPVVVQAFGQYTDEATGQPAEIPANAPLRAALAQTGAGTHQVAVTAITELAARNAQASTGGFAAGSIAQANAVVSQQFGFDVVTTQPVLPTAAALDAAGAAARNYTYALATLSQQASATGNVTQLLTSLANDLTDGRFSREILDAFDRASANFFAAANPNNRTGRATPPENNAKVGRTPFTLRLVITGTTVPVSGVMLKLTLPAGSLLATDAAGQLAEGGVSTSGDAAGSIIVPNYVPGTASVRGTLTLGLITSNAFAAGEFATVKADLPGVQLPATGDFPMSEVEIIGSDGAVIPTASVSVTVEAR